MRTTRAEPSRLRCGVLCLLAAALLFVRLCAPAAAQQSGDHDDAPAPASTADADPAIATGVVAALPAIPDHLRIAQSRRNYALAATGALYGGLYGWTYLAWYQRSPESDGFKILDEGWFGEDTYAGGADKLGHFWTNYALTRAVTGILQWGGYPKRTALPAALALTAGFFAMNEVKDGYHKNYGFSWGDVIANVLGDAAAVLMELNPKVDEMFDIRLEYFPSKGYLRAINHGNPFNSPEDYSGQAYLLAYHLASLESVRTSRSFGWLQYFDLSLGYRAVNYLPENDAPLRRRLYVGVSLNLQRFVDRFVMPRGAGVAAAPPLSTGARALRFATEIYAPPYTTFEIDVLRLTTEKTEPEQP